MNSSSHDLVVIGAGPGGYVAAIRAGQLGLNTACVEKEPALGGTCLRIGCIPSKVLLESSERFVEAQKELALHGIKVDGVRLDLPAMMKRKNDIVSMLTKGVDSLFKKNKVTRYTGTGRIAGPGRVIVEGGAESVELRAKHIVIAPLRCRASNGTANSSAPARKPCPLPPCRGISSSSAPVSSGSNWVRSGVGLAPR
jgi:dihydrolipoamide dehydrogenase